MCIPIRLFLDETKDELLDYPYRITHIIMLQIRQFVYVNDND